jgi:N-acyl-D-aspartate/D-glutamate deacylase
MSSSIDPIGPDLLIRGGTVVTAVGTRRADVAVRAGSIDTVEPELGELAASARDVVDADGLLVLPGIVDVHTHTRVASDAEPDRFFQDSVAAAFGGTTTFLAFNNPGTGSSAAAHRSILAGVEEIRGTPAAASPFSTDSRSGTWSVAIRSSRPSAIPVQSASRSTARRRGGEISQRAQASGSGSS